MAPSLSSGLFGKPFPTSQVCMLTYLLDTSTVHTNHFSDFKKRLSKYLLAAPLLHTLPEVFYARGRRAVVLPGCSDRHRTEELDARPQNGKKNPHRGGRQMSPGGGCPPTHPSLTPSYLARLPSHSPCTGLRRKVNYQHNALRVGSTPPTDRHQ